MSIPGSSSPLFFQTAAAGAASTRTLQKSVRFNGGDSAYLSRTPSSAGNRKTWTFSTWCKMAAPGQAEIIFNAQNGTTQNFASNFWILFDAGVLSVGDGSVDFLYSQYLRDPSAWYHIVVACDTTQSSASDRLKIYINGVEADYTGDSRSSISQNSDTAINSTFLHRIGDSGSYHAYFDGYLADTYLIDGSALDPTSFGAFDDNGVWQCKTFSGTFGTNGFHLFDFENESGIGNDASGNDNDFTVNNITSSISSGNTGPWTSGFRDGASPGGVWNSASATTVSSGDSWSTNGNNDELHIDTGSLGSSYNLVLTKTGGSNEMDVFSSSSGSSGGSRVTNSSSSITISSGTSSHTFQRYVRIGGSGGGNVTFSITGTAFGDAASDLDVLFDVPTNGTQSDTGAGGEVSGNYATFNPLSDGLGCTVSEGNLQLSGSATSSARINGTIGVSSGKWYFEVTYTADDSYTLAGVGQDDITNQYPGQDAKSYAFDFFQGKKYNNGSQTTYGSTLSAGDVFMCALDLDNNKIFFGKNGTFFDSSNPASGANPAYTVTAGTYHIVARLNPSGFASGNAIIDLNAGQRAFAYSAPSGYKALCTTNLPTPTIADGSAHFESKLYTGNGSTNALTMSNSSMSPDWVWIHARSTTGDHEMFDVIRGANYVLESNSTNQSSSVSNTLTSFDSNGFTLGSSSLVNDNNVTYVAYAWDGGSSNATNTSGSVNSTVRANTAAGFSIVKWSGTGSAETVGHGLGAKPHLIISHKISGSGQWPTYNAEIGATKYMYFNSTIEARTYQHFWNNTEPTSSVFSIGTDTDVSHNGNTHIAYCFAPVEGYQAMGKYNGTGSSPGEFVYTGFRPALVMIKRITVGESWVFYDTSRDINNPTVTRAWADLNYGDSTNTSHYIDILSNGFKVRSGGGLLGASGSEYFYWAIAENPFQANGGLAR